MGRINLRGPRWASVVVGWWLLSATARATFKNDFNLYPAGARTCLYEAADTSLCSGDDVVTMNSCLCGNGGDFITLTAECVGLEDSDDLSAVYSTMVAACDYTGTPIQMTELNFMEFGSVPDVLTTDTTPTTTTKPTTTQPTTMPTTTTPTTTTSRDTTTPVAHSVTGTTTAAAATKTSTQNNDGGGGGGDDGGGDGGDGSVLSGGRKTAVIVGASVGGVVVLVVVAVLIFCLRRRYRRTSADEKNPVLPSPDPDPASYYYRPPGPTTTELDHLTGPANASGTSSGDPYPTVGLWANTSYESTTANMSELSSGGQHARSREALPTAYYPRYGIQSECAARGILSVF